MSRPVHNSAFASRSKVTMRRSLLDIVGGAVIDAYCGPRGMMWREVWAGAASYTGIDREWVPTDKRRRFVGDTLVFLSELDLTAFSIVDVDAFGSPWEALEIVSRRRTLRPGELFGIASTDGVGANVGFQGRLPAGLATLLGLPREGWPKNRDHLASMRHAGWDAIAERMRARIEKHWQFSGIGERGGSFEMVYDALILRGLGG